MRGCLYVFLLFICLSQVSLTAQNKVTLSGEVSEKNGPLLSMVTIAIENTTSGTYTDTKGRYSLAMTPGKHTIIVSSLGYETITYKIDIRSNKKLDFVLEENAVALHSVDVYGKTNTQKVREGVFAVNALDIKPLVNSLNDVTTMVNRTTGIKVREEGGVGSDFDLSINGMSGNSVRYFIDGRPFSSIGSDASLANLPVNMIDRVEVYKGVVPASLGADALGGAINIITRQEKKNYLDVSYGIGSFSTHRFNLYGQYADKKTGIIVRPTLGINYSKNNYWMKGVEVWDRQAEEFKKVDLKRFHDDYFSVLAQLEAGIEKRTWADAFFISASYFSVDKELQTGTTQSIVYGKARRESDAWSISARYQKKELLIPKLHLNASLSHTWDHSLTVDTAYRKYRWDGTYIESSRNEITGRSRSLRTYKRPLTIVRANLDYPLNDSHVLNLNYLLNRTGNRRYDDFDTNFEPSNDVLAKQILGLSYNQSFVGGRLNNTFFIKDYINHLSVEQTDLSWITGSADEAGSSTKNNVGYGVGSRFVVFEPLALKASFEHSVRLPLARELLGNGTTVYPNFKLRPESSNNVNLGLFGTANVAPRHLLFYELNAFYRNVDDYIRAVVSEADGTIQYENVSSVDVKGIEGEVRYNYSDIFQAIANCSYQDARSKTQYYPNGKPMITYNNRIPNSPWLFSNIELNFFQRNLFAKNSLLRVGYNYQYVHWFFLTWKGYGSAESKSKIPTQHINNAVVSYSWQNERYNLSLECNNLFDRKAYDNFMLQKPGRSFFCKFRFFLN